MNILDKFSLAGKNALVTCPEYTYGREISSGLARAGASVYLAGPDELRLIEMMNYLEKSGTPAKGYFVYTQGTADAADELASAYTAKAGALDILVDNSTGKHTDGFAGHTFSEIYDDLKFSQLGMMLTVQKMGALMAERGRGSVILVSDYAALVGCDPENYKGCEDYAPHDFSVDYGYVRGSLVNYARQSAGYLGEHNCRCNCIAFGLMDGEVPDAFAKAYIRHSHIKRLANADDIAQAAVFFASDASEFITGTTVPVDGGYTSK